MGETVGARAIDRERVVSPSHRKCLVRALENAKWDRDRVALAIGHERGFTFRVYNPERVDMLRLLELVEAMKYEGLTLPGAA